jgi:membrane protein implicated in regulation of membrane protease activity
MNHIATPSPDKRGSTFSGSRKSDARARLFARRAEALIIAASVLLMAFMTLGGLCMVLTGVLLHQIGMPGYVIWPTVAGVGFLSLAGALHVAQLAWRYETGRVDTAPQPESDNNPKAARKTSRAA